MPRAKQNIPANENNSQRFVRLANARVNTILTNLKGLGTLGNTNQYTSSAEQRKKIETAIKDALERAMQSMSKGEAVQEFKL